MVCKNNYSFLLSVFAVNFKLINIYAIFCV